MSDTPQTDDRTYRADCLGKTLVVNADWAKLLERENAELREKLNDAAISFQRISREAGYTEALKEMPLVRGYAFACYCNAADVAQWQDQ